MAYVPNSGSVVAFQSDPSQLQASVTGTVSIRNNPSISGTVNVSSLTSMPGIVSAANSTTATLGGGAAFTGTSEEVKDFGSIVINVFADQVSATDGLSIQQSSNGTNWDITDVYTVAASTGKTFQVQPAARFFRLIYTNGATPQGVFRLQTIFHPQMVKPTSQRAQDAYTNETDLEQQQGFNMVFNGATWDRLKGTTSGVAVYGSVVAVLTSPSIIAVQGGTRVTSLVSTIPSSVMVGASIFGQLPGGTAVLGSVATLQGTNPWIVVGSVYGNIAGSVVAFQGTNPWVMGSIVGTYGEDVPSTAADKGIFTLGIRNDTVASLIGADLDYTGWSTDSAGRHLVKPFAAEEAVLRGNGSVNGVASVQLLAAGGAGLKTYLTDVSISNSGAAATIVNFTDGDASIIGRTIAPAGGGSNLIGLQVPMVTMKTNTPINMVALTATSVLYGAAYGYKAP